MRLKTFFEKNIGKIYILLIIGAIFLVYSSVLDDYFVLDDFGHVGRADLAHSVGYTMEQYIKYTFYPLLSSYYRPITPIFFFFIYTLSSLNPLGYNIALILFHSINAILVYILIHLIFQNKHVSFLSALFFSLSPSYYTEVFWISDLTYILATTFYLLTIIFFIKYIKQRKKLFYLLTLPLFILSFLTYEGATSLVLVLMLCILIFHENIKEVTFVGLLRYAIIPFIFTIYLLVRLFNFHLSPTLGAQYFLGFHFIKNIPIYIILYFLPFINFFRSAGAYSNYELIIYNNYIIGVVVLTLIFLLLLTPKEVRFFIFWIPITLLPFSFFIPVKNTLHLYLPSIGVSSLLAITVFSIYKTLKKISPKISFFVVCVFIVGIMLPSISLINSYYASFEEVAQRSFKNSMINEIKDYTFSKNSTLYFEDCGNIPEPFLRAVIKSELPTLEINVRCIQYNSEEKNLNNAFIILKRAINDAPILTENITLNNNTYLYDNYNHTIRKLVWE